jgi:type II secretory pathway pseudopilin PulG
MDRSLLKLLLISALSAALVVPLFFYSRSLMRQAEQAVAAAKAAEEAADEAHKSERSGHTDAGSNTGHAQADQDTHKDAHGTAASADAAPGDKPSPAQAVAEAATDKAQDDDAGQVYKPPLFGSCKRLFQQLQKREVAEGEYKAFAFAFDGKVANCADYVSNKSMRHARAVVLKNCQEDRHDKRYVPCLLYEVQ